MSGPGGNQSNGADRGVNYRALDDLFQLVQERAGTTKYTVMVSVLEIYNESCRDLLANQGGQKIEILATGRAGQNTPDAVMHRVDSPEDVAAVMREGEVNRAVGATAMNEAGGCTPLNAVDP
jgi:kinesin family protein C2/C3